MEISIVFSIVFYSIFPPSFFLYSLSLCIPYIIFVASFFVSYLYSTIAGWCCSLETVGSCLERRNGNKRRQVIKIRGRLKRNMSRRMLFTMIDLVDMHIENWYILYVLYLLTFNDTCHIDTHASTTRRYLLHSRITRVFPLWLVERVSSMHLRWAAGWRGEAGCLCSSSISSMYHATS